MVAFVGWDKVPPEAMYGYYHQSGAAVKIIGKLTTNDKFRPEPSAMSFIEMTGASLRRAMHEDELNEGDLAKARVVDDTIVRINREGDIEVRRPHGWDVIGGLLGGFEERIRHETGLDWA